MRTKIPKFPKLIGADGKERPVKNRPPAIMAANVDELERILKRVAEGADTEELDGFMKTALAAPSDLEDTMERVSAGNVPPAKGAATQPVTIAGDFEVVEVKDSTKPAPTFVGRPPSTGDATRVFLNRDSPAQPVSSDPPADPLHVSEVLKMLQKLWWQLTEEERRVFLHWARREGKKKRLR